MKRVARVQVYKDTSKEWRSRIVARNGKIVATGAEGYKHKRQVIRMALKYFSADLPIETLG